MNTEKVTRVEIVDHTDCTHCDGAGRYENGAECGACAGNGMPGRSVVFWNNEKQVDLQLQDDERTLKIFINKKEKQNAAHAQRVQS